MEQRYPILTDGELLAMCRRPVDPDNANLLGLVCTTLCADWVKYER